MPENALYLYILCRASTYSNLYFDYLVLLYYTIYIGDETMNYLPINENILFSHKPDCWAYYCYLYKCIKHTHLNFMNTITINISIDAARTRYGRAYADLSQPV